MFYRLSLTLVLAMRLIGDLHAEQMDEYKLKAAFLANFAQFVDWPAEAFQSPEQPFSICVLGEDPFGRALDDVVAGKAIAGRPLAARRISDARQIGGCHILFAGSSGGKRVLSILAAANRPGLLTVGDAGNSASERMIINFTLKNGTIRFVINIAAADEEKLRFSSRLLSLATIVRK